MDAELDGELDIELDTSELDTQPDAELSQMANNRRTQSASVSRSNGSKLFILFIKIYRAKAPSPFC